MMSLNFTDKLPFHTVFLHPMVRDEEGAKMSKSKGNVIDPLEVTDGCSLQVLIDKIANSTLSESEKKTGITNKQKKFKDGIPPCGTDALRFALLAYMNQGAINLNVEHVVGYREFCNKLWNIVKFGLLQFPEDFKPRKGGFKGMEKQLSLSDKWILTRLNTLIQQTNDAFDTFKLGDAVQNLYDFFKKELAAVYIEAIKPIMKGEDAKKKEAALNTLYVCLDAGLKMLHPATPYVTEELWQRLPHDKATVADSICIAAFPKASDVPSFAKEKAEEHMDALNDTIEKFRSQLAALKVASNAKPTIFVQT